MSNENYYGDFEIREEPVSEDRPPSGEDIAHAEQQIEMAGQANREAIEWTMMSHRTDPLDELGTIAALVAFAMKQDPAKIAIMWAEAIFRISDREVHSNG